MGLEKIAAAAERFDAVSRAPLGFAFTDLQSGERVSCHGGEAFPTASAFKLFVLAELSLAVYEAWMED